MHELHSKKRIAARGNRLKRQRRPLNFRAFFKRGARVAGALTVLALAVVICHELYGVIARTTFLRLERIETNATNRLTREDIMALSGVRIGDDLLSVRLDHVGELLMKSPWVQKVQVRRHFPHTLSIEVTEREPVAIVNLGYLYYLDMNGEVFKPLNTGDSLDYPVLTGFSEEDMWKDPNGSREALKGALGLVKMLAGGNVLRLADISEIHYDKGYGYTLFTMSGGVPVKLGNSRFEEKLARLSRIYRELQAELPLLEYIDLDYGDRIIVKKA